jgi:hypothetical protein
MVRESHSTYIFVSFSVLFSLYSFVANLKEVEISYGALQVDSLLHLWSLQRPVAKNVMVIRGSIGRSSTSGCLNYMLSELPKPKLSDKVNFLYCDPATVLFSHPLEACFAQSGFVWALSP